MQALSKRGTIIHKLRILRRLDEKAINFEQAAAELGVLPKSVHTIVKNRATLEEFEGRVLRNRTRVGKEP